MLDIEALLISTGHEVCDPEEEAFIIFCQTATSLNLGLVNSDSSQLNVKVGNRDYLIHQSRSLLSSDRCGGTTGAVVWKITSLFANWLITPSNPLFKHNILNSGSNILELGCGVSGIIAITLKSLVRRYVLTDQSYVMKLLRENLHENISIDAKNSLIKNRKLSKLKSKNGCAMTGGSIFEIDNVLATPLDWETDEITCRFSKAFCDGGFDAVIACDCIYNETLIKPLVQTCADVCQLRLSQEDLSPTFCIFAQQLRHSDIFEAWLEALCLKFRVWRIPDEELTQELNINSGYSVHVAILK